MLSVLGYAVEHLKVQHIIVCGHQRCGGVQAALSNQDFGLLNKWLRNIKDVYRANAEALDAISDTDERLELLIKLNVATQVRNIAETSIVQKAWAAGQSLAIHGWLYDLHSGLLTDLKHTIDGPDRLHHIYRY